MLGNVLMWICIHDFDNNQKQSLFYVAKNVGRWQNKQSDYRQDNIPM